MIRRVYAQTRQDLVLAKLYNHRRKINLMFACVLDYITVQ